MKFYLTHNFGKFNRHLGFHKWTEMDTGLSALTLWWGFGSLTLYYSL